MREVDKTGQEGFQEARTLYRVWLRPDLIIWAAKAVYRELPTWSIGSCLRGASGIIYKTPDKNLAPSRLTQFFHYPKNQKYIYSSDSYPQEWISQSFSLTCPTKVNFPENGSVGRPNGLENTPRGCTIHSEEVWARGEPWRPIS